MWNNWVGRRIQASNRKQLAWSLVLCGTAGLLLFLLRSDLYNFRFGPFPVDQPTLAAVRDPGDLQQYYVTLEAQEQNKAGTVKSGKTGQPVAEYLVARIHGRDRDKGLVVKVGVNHQGNTFTGKIRPFDAEEQAKILKNWEENAPGLVLPFVLDAAGHAFVGGVISCLVLIALLLLPGLWWAVRAVRRMVTPGLHPLARALTRFGPLAEVAAAIEQEIRPGKPLRVGPVEFVGSWLICRYLGRGYKVFRLEDMVWAHKLIVRINGVPHHWAKLFDRHGEFFQVQSSAKIIDGILTAIATLSPWLIAGYDPQLEDIWKRNPKTLIDAVAQRRQEYLASHPPAAGDSGPAEETKDKPPG